MEVKWLDNTWQQKEKWKDRGKKRRKSKRGRTQVTKNSKFAAPDLTRALGSSSFAFVRCVYPVHVAALLHVLHRNMQCDVQTQTGPCTIS